ncbi:LysE family translocator [Sporolactobacillus sp. CPB3-1]|uniref:LysE family translocator n=1 Tax=Sporolactobacillus mangiferae TaxID=2940498 RepID=A0ABT0M9T2_9BACL|nr:LysE family translocator [Sporolactobacillus mangiferae]MCL1631403.1 LysE family translocator [Sporolactobacillus mangiferae]
MENYLFYLFVSCLLVLLPGPDMALATRNTLMSGRSAGFRTICGTSSALMIHTSAAALGLSALLVHSAAAFSLFKYIGACYLFYLGVRTLSGLHKQSHQNHPGIHLQTKQKTTSIKISFFQGFITNLTNPKVAVFFLTFLPQFIRPGNHSIVPFFILGISQIIINLILLSLYVLLIASFSQWLHRPNVQRIIQGTTGFFLIGFGIQLALTHHR